jgi:dTDP-4-dehydrorhamnose reductase
MKKTHLIIGRGNLGWDLQDTITQYTDDRILLLSRSLGTDAANGAQLLEDLRGEHFDTVWYCVGYGSVQEAKDQPLRSRVIHVSTPLLLARALPEHIRLVFFSSDYAADEVNPSRVDLQAAPPRSKYAQIKIDLETEIARLDRPNTAVIRVGSLYGAHKPAGTFPGKILKNCLGSRHVLRLPSNYVTPTPTPWLARVLIANERRLFSPDGARRHHCAPEGNVSIIDWAKIILSGLVSPKRFHRQRFFDQERPAFSHLKTSFIDLDWHWYRLWQAYYKSADYMPVDITEPAMHD